MAVSDTRTHVSIKLEEVMKVFCLFQTEQYSCLIFAMYYQHMMNVEIYHQLGLGSLDSVF